MIHAGGDLYISVEISSDEESELDEEEVTLMERVASQDQVEQAPVLVADLQQDVRPDHGVVEELEVGDDRQEAVERESERGGGEERLHFPLGRRRVRGAEGDQAQLEDRIDPEVPGPLLGTPVRWGWLAANRLLGRLGLCS